MFWDSLYLIENKTLFNEQEFFECQLRNSHNLVTNPNIAAADLQMYNSNIVSRFLISRFNFCAALIVFVDSVFSIVFLLILLIKVLILGLVVNGNSLKSFRTFELMPSSFTCFFNLVLWPMLLLVQIKLESRSFQALIFTWEICYFKQWFSLERFVVEVRQRQL